MAGPYNLRFLHGSTHLVVGPSGSGKTHRVARLLRLKDVIIRGGENIKNVVFCYAAWQDEYQKLNDAGVVTRWVNKMPSNEEFIQLVSPFRKKGGSIVVIDDFMSEMNSDMDEIVRVSSRHNETSTFILLQCLFPHQKCARHISLNAKYMHVHKNPRENAQIQCLARQIAPEASKWIVEAFHEATGRPYSAFLIDLTQEREPHLRFISDYLPEEFPMKAYISKKWKLRI